MRQSALGEYESSGEQCPSCERSFETRRGLGQHHSFAHGESLLDYEKKHSAGVGCPKGCGNFRDLRTHWGVVHDEPFPDGTDRIECPKGCGWYEYPLAHWVLVHPDSTYPEDVPAMTEEVRAKKSKSASGENNPWYGTSLSEEHRQNIANAITGMDKPSMQGRSLSDEHRKKVSEANIGRQFTEETRAKISNALSGQTIPDSQRQKISETLEGRSLPKEHVNNILRGLSGKVCVIPTTHAVRSGWEREIDLMLYDEGYDFEYEPKTFTIGDGRKYTPDFRVGNSIIEVKGKNWSDAGTRAELFMEAHPEYQYVVIGTELPADVWLPWEERARLPQILDTGG